MSGASFSSLYWKTLVLINLVELTSLDHSCLLVPNVCEEFKWAFFIRLHTTIFPFEYNSFQTSQPQFFTSGTENVGLQPSNQLSQVKHLQLQPVSQAVKLCPPWQTPLIRCIKTTSFSETNIRCSSKSRPIRNCQRFDYDFFPRGGGGSGKVNTHFIMGQKS